MTASPHPAPTRLGPETVTHALLEAVCDGAGAAVADVAVLELLGPGAVACMQGLLTNDVDPDGAFVYGALLTAKGMIVVDGWVSRQGARVGYTVPASGRDDVTEIYRRSIPPRLARWRDRTDECVVLRLVGARARSVSARAGVPLPETPGRAIEALTHGTACEVALAPPGAPFAVQITVAREDIGLLREALATAGVQILDPAALDLARLLVGWPALGAEVDERTIPQEVRLDEIGGVSYTKGCYTGQETVSRLHFRGHTNRNLRGLLFEAEPGPDAVVRTGERDAGRVTSMAWIPAGARMPRLGRWIGLGVLRRDVTPGATVTAAGVAARVVDLPFSLPYIEPA